MWNGDEGHASNDALTLCSTVHVERGQGSFTCISSGKTALLGLGALGDGGL